MKRVFKWLLCGLIAVVLIGAIAFANFWCFRPWNINWFYNRVFLQFALDRPELLSSLRLLEQIGIRAHNSKFDDESPAQEERAAQRREQYYETLHQYDRAKLEGQDLLSYDILDYYIGKQIEGDRFRDYNLPVNQMFGVQSGVPDFMTDTHQVNDQRDARDYITRLGKFGLKFDQVIEGLKKRESQDLVPPRFTVEKVLEQMRGFIEPAPDAHMLYTTFREKLDKLEAGTLDASTKDELLRNAAGEIERTVYPAYRRLIAHYEALLPRVTSNDGVWRLLGGDAYYAYQVQMHTTTSMTPDQVHEMGLKEVERIGAEMDEILKGAGYIDGTIGERVQKLSEAPEQMYPDNDEGRAQILKDYQSIIDEISAKLDPYFSITPEAGVEVKRVPVFSEKTAPGAYYQGPAMDGSRPGVFYANLRSVPEVAKFGMRTLAYHEAVPGHHFQVSIQQELQGLPIFRQVIPFTAYMEGWALYAERLAWEAGFQKDPLDNLGRLQAEMFRACRLVTDTGMHAKRWSREQAVQYMRDHTGMGEKDVTSEIERYLVMPGQALAYKVGMMKILQLREHAREQLGDKFDIRDFHQAVLKNGAMPLTVLENVVNEYIAVKKG